MIYAAGADLNGDAKLYGFVAGNILDNFCVSVSLPQTGECAPHWGGNQLPGYPLFIALFWALFQRSVEAVLVAQSAFFAVCVVMLSRALKQAKFPVGAIWCAVIVLGVSPSLVGWSRSLLTETLSLALTILLLSEIIYSMAISRIRPLPLGVILACGFFVRYDFALLAIPVAVAGFMIHGPVGALRKGLIVVLIVGLPVAAWTLRSVVHGLPPTPPIGLTAKGQQLPTGMMRWVGTWLDNQYDLGKSIWALVHFDYNKFDPPPKAFRNAEERRQIIALLNTLRSETVKSPPASEIDLTFEAVAQAKIRETGWDYWIFLPIRRAFSMWLSPYPSMGWPAAIDEESRGSIRAQISDRSFTGVLEAAISAPGAALAKGLVSFHRYLLLACSLIMLYWSSRLSAIERKLLWITLVYALVRTTFFANTLLIETRYLAPSLAWMDVAIAISAFSIIRGMI